jgi:hypothetical protein
VTIITDVTGRWELAAPHARIAHRPGGAQDFPDGRWAHLTEPALDHCPQPWRDDDTASLIDEAIDTLVVWRRGHTADVAARLAAIASLIEELEARLPETIFEARDQDHTWAEIADRLAMVASTVRHRYGDYVACRKEMPLDDND